MNTELHFSSKTDQWATPQDFFDTVSKEFGGFDIDVAADDSNSKCGLFFSEAADGLKQDWHTKLPDVYGDDDYNRLWMNPPYGRAIGKWVEKAYNESRKGCLVVALLPSRTCTRWFHSYIYNQPGVEIRFLKGRLKFGEAINSAPFPSMLVIFHPHKHTPSLEEASA